MKSQKKIIISRLFGFDQRMTAFFFDPIDSDQLRERPEQILYDSWEFGSEKQILIRAALDIWSSSGNLFLWELLDGLSQESTEKVISALANCKRIETKSGIQNSIAIGPKS